MYIPKNKIITNLYTNGTGEGNPDGSDNGFIRSPLYIKGTNLIYEGYYWKDYKGKYYTGKTPNDKPTQELVFIKRNTVNNETSQRFQTTVNNSPSNYPFPGEEETTLFVPSLPQEYINIINPNSKMPPPNVNLPTHYYPKPTQEDYKIGAFRRYFCVKANENIFLEIDEKTFKALSTQDDKWRWNLYDPFFVEWVLIGDQSNVRTANFNSSKIVEEIKVGFQKFLRFNYLKFYQPPTKESKITSSTPPPNPTQPNSSMGGY
jgi:hypothetical protein